MIAYFDTSALIKLTIPEEGSQLASRAWEAADTRVTSRVTYPEARAALATAARTGRLTRNAHGLAKRSFEHRVAQTIIIELGEGLARLAGDAAERFALRGFDAIHVASALAIEADDAVLITWDEAQIVAAQEAGLRVLTGS